MRTLLFLCSVITSQALSYYTTPRPEERTTAPSCRHMCGVHMGSCSCTSSCQYHGNCCNDFYYYCDPSTQPTTQPPIEPTTAPPTQPPTEPPTQPPTEPPTQPSIAPPSCRNRCGSHLGSCSCTFSCQYYGNCCYDYNNYCDPPTDPPTQPPTAPPTQPPTEPPTQPPTEPPTEPPTLPTAPPSCRNRCGSHLGSCSCTFSCQYYGNCCYDYNNYCDPLTEPSTQQPTDPPTQTPTEQTTQPPIDPPTQPPTKPPTQPPTEPPTQPPTEPPTEPPTQQPTAPPSCRNRCGSHLGSCSCTFSCQYYGNCCYDYNNYCNPPTQPPTDPPTEPSTEPPTQPPTEPPTQPPTEPSTAPPSCRNRCGSHLGSCSCSSSCQYYGNCCYDYNIYCSITTQGPQTTTGQPSCRYNCGRHMGSCSCSSSCLYQGNCCYDFQYHCSATTAMTAVPPTTSQASCRHKCGYNMGSCSCTSYCRNYGNCCYDYSYYCYPTTASPTVTAQPSCRHNCGYNLGSCSCSSSCRYNGNCCRDYYSYCSATTPYPTTAQPSCRHNCGYNLGSCSCSSSCRYYGNCCRDYYSYCSATTPYPTTAQPSCRHNCGYNLGSCSCSSSCRYNGNCCRDYYSYCSATTPYPTTAAPCGGSLSGSGMLTSPNHPNHYQDNMYCVWQLRASNDETVYLSFTYMQLENCCGCDYIAVYDGPSVHSRYLGKVCNGTMTAFKSSSNYMTVLFRTDGSVVGRGFKADFTSSLPPSSVIKNAARPKQQMASKTNAGRVNCSSENMNIVIERSYLNSLGYGGHRLFLNDENCRPRVSSSQVIFNFPINSCGTTQEYEHSRVVYTNAVRAFSSPHGEITRQSFLKLNVGCQMERDATAQLMYIARHHENSSIIGTGRFNATMAFYTSSSFHYQVTEVPYQVTLNQNLYVQLSLWRFHGDIVLFLDTCVASPSPHDFQTRSYYLVRNGCPRDSTYYAYASGTRSYARFRFRAFQFLRTTESVFLQCKVIICSQFDKNSRCRQGCHSRVARDLGSEHDSQTLVLGPIQLKEPKKQEGTQKKEV